MTAKAGEKARETGDFVCKGCDESIRVRKGHTLPTCECGSTEFEERRNEPGNKSTSPGRRRAPAGERRKATTARRPTARRGAAASRGGTKKRAATPKRRTARKSKASRSRSRA